jgi:hypothetical protein
VKHHQARQEHRAPDFLAIARKLGTTIDVLMSRIPKGDQNLAGAPGGNSNTYMSPRGAAVLAKVGQRLDLVAGALAPQLETRLARVLPADHARGGGGELLPAPDLVSQDVHVLLREARAGLPFFSDSAHVSGDGE